ncbi:MAG: hypothetical protein ABR99_05850 [Rhodobacter sp. BACL10 MAG-121220-bin24]|nr:MAG: hypothetical protein ABR99_05850 [Rhodobacter sp. BACL10 MAG-121220-bin24]
MALFTVISAPVPARQLNALYFGSGRNMGALWVSFDFPILKKISWRACLLGTMGFLAFTSFTTAH